MAPVAQNNNLNSANAPPAPAQTSVVRPAVAPAVQPPPSAPPIPPPPPIQYTSYLEFSLFGGAFTMKPPLFGAIASTQTAPTYQKREDQKKYAPPKSLTEQNIDALLQAHAMAAYQR